MKTFQAVLQAFQENGDVSWAPDYAEPGYEANPKGVLFANWNEVTRYNPDTKTFDVLDRTLVRMGELAEKQDYCIEWSDEWTTCGECGKAVRTSADSYGWKRSYAETDGDVQCRFCVQSDPSFYLESLEGDSRKAETIGIELEAHGYVKVGGDYEHGWHPGQNDSPDVVADGLRKRGITRFIFKVDAVGQFDVNFSVYVHEDETEKLGDAPVASALPYDPGTEMGKALRGEPTEHYQTTVRTITPEEFVSGDWVKDR